MPDKTGTCVPKLMGNDLALLDDNLKTLDMYAPPVAPRAAVPQALALTVPVLRSTGTITMNLHTFDKIPFAV